MNVNRKCGKQIMDDIRDVLYNDWDPYCVKGQAPNDEYDFCIAKIYRLLTENPTVEKIVDCLLMLNNGRNKKEQLIQVAHKLLEIDVSISQ